LSRVYNSILTQCKWHGQWDRNPRNLQCQKLNQKLRVLLRIFPNMVPQKIAARTTKDHNMHLRCEKGKCFPSPKDNGSSTSSFSAKQHTKRQPRVAAVKESSCKSLQSCAAEERQMEVQEGSMNHTPTNISILKDHAWHSCCTVRTQTLKARSHTTTKCVMITDGCSAKKCNIVVSFEKSELEHNFAEDGGRWY
jgi:hypothetical protein